MKRDYSKTLVKSGHTPERAAGMLDRFKSGNSSGQGETTFTSSHERGPRSRWYGLQASKQRFKPQTSRVSLGKVSDHLDKAQTYAGEDEEEPACIP